MCVGAVAWLAVLSVYDSRERRLPNWLTLPGDVKLALGLAVTGYFGVDVWLLAAVTAPLLTAAWALITLATSGERTVPHGPAMCFSTAPQQR